MKAKQGKHVIRILLVGICAVLLGVGAYFTLSQAAPISLPFDDPARVAEGERLYAEHCASCHGANLEGEEDWQSPGPDGRMPAPPHDETGHTWHHADELLFRITKEGSAAVIGRGYESNMMGFGDVLTDEEILSILGYIKSTWPDEVISSHEQMNGRPG